MSANSVGQLVIDLNNARARIAKLETLAQQRDTMLGKRPCQNNRCNELAAARALLTQTLAQDDEAIADMKVLGCMEALPADAFALTERIRAFLAVGAA